MIILENLKFVFKSLIKMINNSGPKFDPSETPEETKIGSDLIPLILRICFLSLKKD